MNPTVKLLQAIGSPLAPDALERVPDDDEAPGLYAHARENKIGLLYLEALNKHGRLGGLQSEYDKGYFRYSETVVTAARLSQVIGSMGVEHAIFKFIKPYPSTPSDVDALFLGPINDYEEAVRGLLAGGYCKIGEAPHQVVVYDLRGGRDNIDVRTKDGKEGGIYYIDLYKEVGASHVIYMDKRKFRKAPTKANLNGNEFETLKPETEVAIAIAHSMLPEQLYTLADYYTTIHYLAASSREGIDDLVSVIRENNIVLAATCSLKIVASLHEAAHGFVPEQVLEALSRLTTKGPSWEKFGENGFTMPYRCSMLTLSRFLLEKMRESAFRRSLARQLMAMMDPRFGGRIVDDLIFRRKRETY